MKKLTFKKIIVAGLWAGITAAMINIIIFFIFHSTGVITDNIFIKPNLPLNAFPVLVASIVPSLIGSFVFFLFEKYTDNGFQYYAVFAAVLLIASFFQPFKAIPGVTVSYALTLNFMHVVVACSLLYFIKRSIQKKDKATN
jgi:hypothetical protein